MRRIKPRCRRGIVYHSSTIEKTLSTRKRQTGVLSKSSKIEENKAKQIELTSRYLYEKKK